MKKIIFTLLILIYLLTVKTVMAASCVESGGNINLFIKGQIKEACFNTNGCVDTCVDSDTVSKFYCVKGVVNNTNMYCPEGYNCTDGACVKKSLNAPKNNFKCVSTNSGLDIYHKGSVTYTDIQDGKVSTHIDFCSVWSPDKVVGKFYCADRNIDSSVLIVCPTGTVCRDGACGSATTVQTCGNDKIDSGEICDTNNLNSQSCVSLGFDSGTLKCTSDCKYFDKSACVKKITPPDQLCGNNKVDTGEACDGTDLNKRSCLSLGYSSGKLKCSVDCKNFDRSACLITTTSTTTSTSTTTKADTDGGMTINIKGTATDKSGSYTDYCVNSRLLHEYFIKNDKVEFIELPCHLGDVCANGACIKDMTVYNNTDAYKDSSTEITYRCVAANLSWQNLSFYDPIKRYNTTYDNPCTATSPGQAPGGKFCYKALCYLGYPKIYLEDKLSNAIYFKDVSNETMNDLVKAKKTDKITEIVKRFVEINYTALYNYSYFPPNWKTYWPTMNFYNSIGACSFAQASGKCYIYNNISKLKLDFKTNDFDCFSLLAAKNAMVYAVSNSLCDE